MPNSSKPSVRDEISNADLQQEIDGFTKQGWRAEDSHGNSEWMIVSPGGSVFMSDDIWGGRILVDDDALPSHMLGKDQQQEEGDAVRFVGLLRTQSARALAKFYYEPKT